MKSNHAMRAVSNYGAYLRHTSVKRNRQMSGFGSSDDAWCDQAGAMWNKYHPNDTANAAEMVNRCKSYWFAPNTDANRLINRLPAGFSANEATAQQNSGWTDTITQNEDAIKKAAADGVAALQRQQQESAARAQAARDEAARQAEQVRQAQIQAEKDRQNANPVNPYVVPGGQRTNPYDPGVGFPNNIIRNQNPAAQSSSKVPLIVGGLGAAALAAFLLLRKA